MKQIKDKNNHSKKGQIIPEDVTECHIKSSIASRLRNKVCSWFWMPNRYKTKSSSPEGNSKRIKTPAMLDTHSFHAGEPKDDETTSDAENLQVGEATSTRIIVRTKTTYDTTNIAYDTNRSKACNTTRLLTEEIGVQVEYARLCELAYWRRSCQQLRHIRDSLILKLEPIQPTAVNELQPSAEQVALRNFLVNHGFLRYYKNFNRHGYTLSTASHINTLDLVYIGITDPLHRMALQFELDQICKDPQPIGDIPEDTGEWLDNLGLSEYTVNFQHNGYYCPLAAIELQSRDLKKMGIFMSGHRKKICLSLYEIRLKVLCKS